MDYVVAFVSQKGGVGKSTLARAVAHEFNKNGFRVKLADMDIQQGTTVNWHQRRLNTELNPVGSVEGFRTYAEAKLSASTGNYDVLIVDGAGRASSATAEIARDADLVVQPSAPGIDDLQPAVLLFHELTKQGISPKKLRIAMTFVGTPNEEALGREYLEHAGYKILDGSLEFRPSYRSALTAGRTITETSHESINARADRLIQSIFSSLQEIVIVEEDATTQEELATS